MSLLYAANVTKYNAGGTGDNCISDGYIKTVEKVWIDSYTFTSAIPSGTTIVVAVIPANKKITGVDVYFPVLSTGASGTGTTISIGYQATTSSAPGGSTFLAAGEANSTTQKLSANQGIGTVTSALSYVTIKTDRIATTTTAGTITTIVRYT